MVNRNLIRNFDDDDLDRDLDAAMADAASGNLAVANLDLNENAIVEGRIIRVDDEFVLVDVGYKSEGQIPRHEWDETEEPPEIGMTERAEPGGQRHRRPISRRPRPGC